MRRRVGLLTGVVALVALGGCGDGDGTRTAKSPAGAAFKRRADSICTSANARIHALPQFPFPTFDPQHPRPARLRAVGRFYTTRGDLRPILRAAIARLEGLGRPPADSQGWQRVLVADRQTLRNVIAQDRAALAGDVSGFVPTVARLQSGALEVERASNAFGLSCRLGEG